MLGEKVGRKAEAHGAEDVFELLAGSTKCVVVTGGTHYPAYSSVWPYASGAPPDGGTGHCLYPL